MEKIKVFAVTLRMLAFAVITGCVVGTALGCVVKALFESLQA